jgi:cytoskeletal protein CcmA (bactofilin family)
VLTDCGILVFSPKFKGAQAALPHPNRRLSLIKSLHGKHRRKDQAVSSQAVARSDARSQQRTTTPKDNWLGFVGDVLKFTGEVTFRSMLRIDGHFSGQVNSSDGTLIVSAGAEVTQAKINVAVAKINGTVEGDIKASKELVLGRTASVTGNVSAHDFIVEEGACFNGICRKI